MSLTHKERSKGLPSASRAAIWMNCPGSHLASLQYPESSSEAADEGTMLHEVMATGKAPIDLTDEQLGAVGRACDLREQISSEVFGEDRPGIYIEERYWLTGKDAEPLCSAQIDRLEADDNKALIIDYKFGRGEVEDALANKQLRVSAACIASHWQFDEIYVAIIQPFAMGDKYSLAVYDKRQMKYCTAEVSHKARIAMIPEQERIPGSKQCQWCPAKRDCPEAISYALVEQTGGEIAPQVMARLMDRCDQAEKVIEAIRGKAFDILAENPEAIPGYEIKQGKPSLSALEQVMREKYPDEKVKDVKAKLSASLEPYIEEKEVVSKRRNITGELELLATLREEHGFTDKDILKATGKIKKGK